MKNPMTGIIGLLPFSVQPAVLVMDDKFL